MLRNEDGQLVSYVFVDVKDLGVPDYVQRARQVLDDRLLIPAGYRLAFAGQYQSFERAKARLQVLVPATLLIVLFMLLMNRSSLGEALVIILAIPFSLIGAVWCLYLLVCSGARPCTWSKVCGCIAPTRIAPERTRVYNLYSLQSFSTDGAV